MPANALTAPIKRHGGKHYLADWIIGLTPEHTHYVEPYFGSGAVMLRKSCEGISEVANDLDGGLSNLWTVLRDEGSFQQLHRLLEATPFSQELFDESKRLLKASGAPADPVTWGWRWFILARQSRQGLMKSFATVSRTRTRRGMNEQVSSWLTAIEGLPEVHERIRRVLITNLPACDLIRQQDGAATHFYCDPPYLHETRVTTRDYACEMSPEDHAELLRVLGSIQGTFQLSGYPSEMYQQAAARHGWRCESRQIDNKASGSRQKPMKTECLWMNY